MRIGPHLRLALKAVLGASLRALPGGDRHLPDAVPGPVFVPSVAPWWRAVKPRTETNTGWLYECEYRGRSENDYAFSGHLNINGRDYQVRVYGPESVRGTAKRRWRLKLTPSDTDAS